MVAGISLLAQTRLTICVLVGLIFFGLPRGYWDIAPLVPLSVWRLHRRVVGRRNASVRRCTSEIQKLHRV